MLSEEDNQLLTSVGPGTRMGALLRRYWHPVAAVLELDEVGIVPVRLLGEDLVLYKDKAGTYGLVERRCPHRGADLVYGIVEDCGLRCSYHGWRFDERGRCTERPFEDVAHPEAPVRDRIGITAYRVAAKAGLLWAYLGPEPAPCLWDWARFHDAGRPEVSFKRIPCNWLQCQENSIDPVHFEWLHQNLPSARFRNGERAPRHLELGFDEFEFGFIYRRVLEGTDKNHPLWTIGRVSLWPECLYAAGGFTWHVPIDDEHTLDVTWDLVGSERAPSNRVPYKHITLARERHGVYSVRDSQHQDAVAMIGQGTIADRRREHLGESDRGVILLRRRLLAEVDALGEGKDPKGLIRDEARNHRVPLPVAPAYRPGRGPDRSRLSSLRRQARGLFGRIEKPARELAGRLRASVATRSDGPDLGQMIHGYRDAALLYVVAKLNVADALADGPRTSQELARALGAHAPSLERILRALVAHRVFFDEDGRFGLTEAGHKLRSGVPGSVRGSALLAGEELMPAWRALVHTARTGETAFEHVFGMPCWEHRQKNPELNEAFNDMIASGARWSAQRTIAAYDFSGLGHLTDVGGGTGLFLAHLLESQPRLRGTLFDMPHVVATAPGVLAGMGVESRCRIVAGDFFTAVPENAGAYLLKNVLHNWDDDRALAILRVCRKAMTAPTARLLVIESLMPAHPAAGDSRVHADISMLAIDGGRERSEVSYRRLLTAGGFALARTIAVARELSLLEARPS